MLFGDDDTTTAILGALTGHPSLEELYLEEDGDFNLCAAAGPALGALLEADSSLKKLTVIRCQLDDVALRPLVLALPRNTRLQTLNIQGNPMSDDFARNVLLPAVRDNTSLRKLTVNEIQYGDPDGEPTFTGHEAVSLVANRN